MISRLLYFALALLSIQFSTQAQGVGSIKGTVIDPSYQEPLIGATVRIENTNMGAVTDLEGDFQINAITPGTYTLIIKYVGFETTKIEGVKVSSDKITFVDEISMTYLQKTLKPIIYLYPKDTTVVNVKLNYDGQLTTTYPKYNDGWTVTATPESNLIDSTGRSYYSLYWEGIPSTPLSINEGTVVAKEETISFLEESLTTLGLNEREANEFIIFWLPILEEKPFNIISFSTVEYETQAALSITPKPDKIIRVMMVYRGLDAPVEIKSQNLDLLRQERSGFTVVEWGGQESVSDQVN